MTPIESFEPTKEKFLEDLIEKNPQLIFDGECIMKFGFKEEGR